MKKTLLSALLTLLSALLVVGVDGFIYWQNSVLESQTGADLVYRTAGIFESTYLVSTSHNLTSIENKAQIASFSGTDEECIESMCGCVLQSMESLWDSAVENELCLKHTLRMDDDYNDFAIRQLYQHGVQGYIIGPPSMLNSAHDAYDSINDFELHFSTLNIAYEHDGTYYSLPPSSYDKFVQYYGLYSTDSEYACGNVVKYLYVNTAIATNQYNKKLCGDKKYKVAPTNEVYRTGDALDTDKLINEKDSSRLIEAATDRLNEKICINMCESRRTHPVTASDFTPGELIAALQAKSNECN